MHHNGLKTVGFWINANIGTILYVLLCIIFFLRHLAWVNGMSDGDLQTISGKNDLVDAKIQLLLLGIAFPIFFGAVFMAPSKTSKETFGRYFFVWISIIMLFVIKHYDEVVDEVVLEMYNVTRPYMIVFFIAHIPAACLALSAWVNFDEIVSRRMLYRNSSYDMFETEVSYVSSVFVDSAVAITTFVILLMAQTSYYKFEALRSGLSALPTDLHLNPDILNGAAQSLAVCQSLFN